MDRDPEMTYVDCYICSGTHPLDENGNHHCPVEGNYDDGDNEDLPLHYSDCEVCGWPEPYYGEDDDD